VLSDRTLARVTMAIPDAGVRFAGRLQAMIFRVTRGRVGGRFGRGPVLVLRTTGRRSGKIRETTVLYERDGDHYVVIGSNAGSERAPAWSLNLLANPEAEILVGGRRMQVRASNASGEERTRLINLMDRRYRGFEAYRARTDRELRVFLLAPR
jgi:deazaflavin-dependent oxidoreductase (nitroreductase family)